MSQTMFFLALNSAYINYDGIISSHKELLQCKMHSDSADNSTEK